MMMVEKKWFWAIFGYWCQIHNGYSFVFKLWNENANDFVCNCQKKKNIVIMEYIEKISINYEIGNFIRVFCFLLIILTILINKKKCYYKF